jgi:ABC-type Zn uptake system ZnuABC Zn-binding protein ZnuA
MAWADVISSALGELDPENAAFYANNAEMYKASLQEIDAEAREKFSLIPEGKRVLVSDHKIFGYFARDYNFENLGALIPSFSTNAEISAGKLAELIEEVHEHEVPAIFVGNTSGEMVQELAKILKSEVDHPLEILTIMTGSLADEEPGDNYLSFIRYNINQIAKGMGSDS